MPPEFQRKSTSLPSASHEPEMTQTRSISSSNNNMTGNNTSSGGGMNGSMNGYGGMGGMGQRGSNMGYSSMQYMMPGMMGYGGMGGGNSPVAWIYSLNQMIFSISYALDMIGMNSQAIQQLYYRIIDIYKNFLLYVKNSKIRKYLQEKSQKSKLFRVILICCTMILTHQIAALFKVHNARMNSNRAISGILRSDVSSSQAVDVSASLLSTGL
jgi:hypothetical protein